MPDKPEAKPEINPEGQAKPPPGNPRDTYLGHDRDLEEELNPNYPLPAT